MARAESRHPSRFPLTLSTEAARAAWNRIVGSASFSRMQAVIGMLAGTVSVCGAFFSVVQFVHPTNTGQLVAVVQEAASHRATPDALVEILTADDALATPLTL